MGSQAVINKAAGEITNLHKVEALEDAAVRDLELLDDLPFVNHFSEGLYCRELPIPAGVFLTGKVHKQDHLAMLIKGEIAIVNGDDTVHLKAPVIIPSKAGVKRAILAITDSIFITVHATTLTDVEEIEKAVVEEPREHIREALK